MGKKRIKIIDDSGQRDQPKGGQTLDGKQVTLSTLKNLRTQKEKKAQRDKKSPHIKSGKAEEARLADMGQKALAELEKIKEKEKQLEKEVIKKASQQKPKAKAKLPKLRSKRYKNIKKNIKSNKKYPLKEALELVIKGATALFDESVEIHLGVKDKLSSLATLPHGIGKKQKVAIADPSPEASGSGQLNALLKKIESGVIDFDILIATPKAMPKLAKVAKILGPKGLMPNPKAGTITDKPEELKKKLESGQIRFKTESKTPLVHFSLGKVSFGKEKLRGNLQAFLMAVGQKNILKATLCSTMGPGVKLDVESLQ